MVTKSGGGEGRQGARTRYSQAGRGGHAAAQFSARSGRQRVAVKARVVRSRPAGQSKASIKAHLRYIRGREEGVERSPGELFNATAEVNREFVSDLAADMALDRHHFRFIISPEAGERLDLKAFTRDLIAEMERDLGTKLEWVAGEHHDSDNPHVHLMVRGKDERGGDLVINREYISRGMREQAGEVATRHLGPRLAQEIERTRQRDLKAERVTALDLQFANETRQRSDGFLMPIQGRSGSLAAPRERVERHTRLQYLESVGLATESRAGLWQVNPQLIERLRERGSRNDIVKLMHRKMHGGSTPLSPVIFSKETPPGRTVTGRVTDRGIADELTDRQHLLIEGLDGQAYYVPLGDYSERPGRHASVGSIVTVRAEAKHAAGKADQNIAGQAAQHGGVYDPLTHLESTGDGRALPPSVSPADYIASHVKRAQALASRGFIEALPEGRYRIPSDLVERVRREIPVGRDGGGVIKIEQESTLGLEQQITALGVTWLDRQLEAGIRPAARVGATPFEREVGRALDRRLTQLQALGLTESRGGIERPRAGFLDRLYQRELVEARDRLRAQYGDFVESPHRFKGRVAAIEALPSGPHVVITEARRFSLVPDRGSLGRQVGQTVEITRAPAHAINRGQPAAFQDHIQFRTLTLTRSRGLRR
jgi:type IV secretory pathway VirD2 relaxase